MSEPVNSLIKTVQPDRPSGPNPKKAADQSDKQVRDIEKDEVFLSDLAKKTLETQDSFDIKKVEAIKQAIEDGNYPLNPRKIAESFIAMESLIGNVKRG